MEGVYLIENSVTNKVYVGSSVNLDAREQRHFKNLKDGVHHSNKLQNSYNKHGKDCFTFKVLESYDEIEYQELLNREQYWIDSYNCYMNGYNCRPIADSNYGHRHSDETKQLMSKLHSGVNNSMYGKKHTDETKAKLSEQLTGRKNSLGTIEKKRLAGLGRTHTDETKLKQSRSKKSKPILQLDMSGNVIKEWYSSGEIMKILEYRVDYVTKNKTKKKHGFYWIDKTEYKSFLNQLME